MVDSGIGTLLLESSQACAMMKSVIIIAGLLGVITDCWLLIPAIGHSLRRLTSLVGARE